MTCLLTFFKRSKVVAVAVAATIPEVHTLGGGRVVVVTSGPVITQSDRVRQITRCAVTTSRGSRTPLSISTASGGHSVITASICGPAALHRFRILKSRKILGTAFLTGTTGMRHAILTTTVPAAGTRWCGETALTSGSTGRCPAIRTATELTLLTVRRVPLLHCACVFWVIRVETENGVVVASCVLHAGYRLRAVAGLSVAVLHSCWFGMCVAVLHPINVPLCV